MLKSYTSIHYEGQAETEASKDTAGRLHLRASHITKYQGVKEFHMLARISCYCKIMVFSPFELGDTHPRVTNDVALSNL